ncbi:MAG: DUF192 domain-containing protein [Desulfobaccales bacterium]
MKTRYLFICLSLIFLVLAGLFLPPFAAAGEELSKYGNPFIWVTLGHVRVQAEVVSSPEKLYLGLGGRPELAAGRGMLFIMPSREVQTFCMRDMRLALDFIWLEPGRVAGLTPNVSPQDQNACYRSPEPVAFVLEVPAGFCERYGIRAGDPASW